MMTMRMSQPHMNLPCDPCNSAVVSGRVSPSRTSLRDDDSMEKILEDSLGNLSLKSPRRESLRPEDVVDVERLRFETKKLL